MAQQKQDPNNRTVAENRKARFSYEVLDTVEAGLVLTGTEVKSLRQGKANIQEAYASHEDGEIWLINSYLPEYLQGNRFNHEPRRRRKLLLKKKEMARRPALRPQRDRPKQQYQQNVYMRKAPSLPEVQTIRQQPRGGDSGGGDRQRPGPQERSRKTRTETPGHERGAFIT